MRKCGTVVSVIGLSETFIRKGSESGVALKGLAFSYCRPDKSRGGICILCTNKIKYKSTELLNTFTDDFVFEGSGIELTDYKCIIVCL